MLTSLSLPTMALLLSESDLGMASPFLSELGCLPLDSFLPRGTRSLPFTWFGGWG